MYSKEFIDRINIATKQLREEYAELVRVSTRPEDHFYYDPSCCSFKLKDSYRESLTTIKQTDLLDEILWVAITLEGSGISKDFRKTLESWEVDLGYKFDFDYPIAYEISRCLDDLQDVIETAPTHR